MTGARRLRRTATAAALGTVLVLGGCSSDGSDATAPTTTASGEAATTTAADDPTTTTAPAETSTTEPEAASTTTVAEPDGETTEGLGSLDEGEHHGYFTGITEGTVEGQAVSVVSWDEVELLTGDEADAAGREQGLIGPDESMPNDYLIRNDDTAAITLPVIPDGIVEVLQDGGAILEPSSITEAVEDTGTLFKVEIVVVRGISLITATEAVYLP